MNLAISPVSVNRNSSINNTRNNQTQNFGILKASFANRNEHYVPRVADAALDTFLAFFEQKAAKIGLNTEKLEQKGFKLSLDSHDLDALDTGYLHGTLLNKSGEAVVKNGKKLDIKMSDLSAEEKAEAFASQIKEAGIIA